MVSRLLRLLALVFVPLFASLALGQVVDPSLPPSGEELQAFFTALGGIQGMSTLALVGLGIQGLMLAFRGPLSSLAGAGKLTLVTGLSLLGGVIGLRAAGLDWALCLMHSTSLAAAQVFLHQLWKQLGSPSIPVLNGASK